MNLATEFGSRIFGDAAREFLESRRNKLGKRTYPLYSRYIQALDRFFGGTRLDAIAPETIAAYQEHRQAEIRATRQHSWAREKLHSDGDSATDGASTINHEIRCILRPVLRRSGLWENAGRFYEPLPVPRESPGIALTEEEEVHLFEVAQRKPRYWMLAYMCSLLSRHTTAGPQELRDLRVRDVDLSARTILLPGTKTESRERKLPLAHEEAFKAAAYLVERYRRIMRDAAIEPCAHHYLLPHRAHKRGELPDPFRHMGSWKKAFYALRAEAGKKYPRLLTMRLYDWRHTACTIMMEDPAIPYSTVEFYMGHKLGSKTKAKYNHLRDRTIRLAAERLGAGRVRVEELPAQLPKKLPKPAQSMSRNELGTVAFWLNSLK